MRTLRAFYRLSVRTACACALLASPAPAQAPVPPPARAAAQPPSAAPSAAPQRSSVPFDHHILVDQFGYLPDESKVAVIRDPQTGYDRNDHFSPGRRYEVRQADDGLPVMSGIATPWRGGAVEPSSGDRGWWFDFSTVAAPGRYYVIDTERNVRSAVFTIDAHVYRDVLRAAMRTYYYQRSGTAKPREFAGECWHDEAAYAGPLQDGEARDVTARDDPARIRDLRGGWFDAGDTNKYVTFAAQPVHQLLTAYAASQGAFGDDLGIPESGNGIPDVIDEVRWETDWLKKMQFPDGSLALKVGELTYVAASPPSSDHSPRFYVPSCTSATIAGAGMLAHAAYVYGNFSQLRGEAQELRERAVLAWNQYERAPAQQTRCDSGIVHAGLADLTVEDQDGLAVEAAVYLFAATGDAAYERYVAKHYHDAHPYHDIGWTRYKPDQGDALLFYAALPHTDLALARSIVADKAADVRAGNGIYGFNPDDDLYRAFLHDAQYHWGSNNPRANYGNANLDAVDVVGTRGASTYRTRALGILHYLHGVNPLGIVYLSNMYRYGATASVNEIYHVWFSANSRWSDARMSACGPPPGYVPGGPNAAAAKDGVPARLSPPTGQPAQKSYRDWNAAWPDSSWAVTEPGIYYQSAYVRLLSAFVR